MSDTKDERVNKARRHLTLATRQWDNACTASWEPTEPADCVSDCFYAFENAVVAAATALGIAWEKNHGKKAELAARLVNYGRGKLTKNIRDLLVELNNVRKDISYGEPGPELAEINLGDQVSELEDYLSQVESLIDDIEESD